MWDIAGRLVTVVFSQFSCQLRRLLVLADLLYDPKMRMKDDISGSVVKKGTTQRLLVERAILRNGTVDMSKMFQPEEVQLIRDCLEFLLCVSLCTCKEFPDLQKYETPPGSGNNRNKSNTSSVDNRPPSADKPKNGMTNGHPLTDPMSHSRPTSSGVSRKDNGWVGNNTDQAR